MAFALQKSAMATGYGAQTYHNNMKNDCALWDTMPLKGARA
jgi:hypothetical protein